MPAIYQDPVSDQERKFFKIASDKFFTRETIVADNENEKEFFLEFYLRNAPNEDIIVDMYVYMNKQTGNIDLAFNRIGGVVVDDANPGTCGFDDPRVIHLLNQMYVSIDPAA